jgi:hypothetical protein
VKKDTKKDATSTTVKVIVPARPGIAIKDIEAAAKREARATGAVPAEVNLSQCQFELASSTKSGDERTYDVKVSWGPDVVSPDLEVDDDPDGTVKAVLSSSPGDHLA